MKKPIFWIGSCFLFVWGCSSQENSAKPEQVLDNSVKWHGGVDNLAKLSQAYIYYNLKGTFPVPGLENVNVDIQVEELYKLPTKIKKVIRGKSLPPNSEVVDMTWIVDGFNYWVKHGNNIQVGKSIKSPETIFRPFNLFQGLAGICSNPTAVELFPNKNSKSYIGIDVLIKKEGASQKVFFDPRNYSMVAVEGTNGLGKKILQEFSDFQDFEGLKLPCVHETRIGGELVVDLKILEVKFFDWIDDKEFEFPKHEK